MSLLLGVTLLALPSLAFAGDWWPDYGYSAFNRYRVYQEFGFTDVDASIDDWKKAYEHEVQANDGRYADLKRPAFWLSNYSSPYLDCGPQTGSDNWAVGNYFYPKYVLNYTWWMYIELVPNNWSVNTGGAFRAQIPGRPSWCLSCNCIGWTTWNTKTKELASFSAAGGGGGDRGVVRGGGRGRAAGERVGRVSAGFPGVLPPQSRPDRDIGGLDSPRGPCFTAPMRKWDMMQRGPVSGWRSAPKVRRFTLQTAESLDGASSAAWLFCRTSCPPSSPS